jgi:MtN3 and saliva related transmembrane protein
MNPEQIANILGFIAAGIGIIVFLPQAWRVWKTKDTKSISLLTFLILVFSSALWTSYGIILSAAPIILVNAIIIVLGSFIVLMKLKHG